MNLQHINIKIFVDGELGVDWQEFIKVFHAWTAAQSMPELLIDVADYRHVPQGPGVVLVGHEADYFMDNSEGQPGLRYSCKVAREGTNEDRLRHAFESASAACGRLEAELPGLQFNRQRFELVVNDRALAANDEANRAALKGLLPELLESIFGAGAEIALPQQDPRKRLTASVALAQPFSLVPA